MLRAINEGILIDGDIEKEIEELKEKLEDKVFFQEGTEFLIFPENKIFYPELKELLDRYGHFLFLLKKQESLIQNNYVQNNIIKTQIIQKKLRSGQKIECEGDLILLGDLAPGAEINAGGNVIIIGNAQGIIHAGSNGDRKAVIVALKMNGNLLRIADIMAKSPEDSSGMYPEIVFVDDSGNFVVEEVKGTEIYNKYISQKLDKKGKKGFSRFFNLNKN